MSFSPVIYVIDDSEIDCLIVSKLLLRKFPSIRISTFHYADEALAEIRKSETGLGLVPSLILLDINMPIKSGWDFLRELRFLYPGRYRETKVIVFTSSINPDEPLLASKYEIVIDFIVKPLKKEDIDDKIGLFIEKNYK